LKKQQLLVISGPIANLTERLGYTLDVLHWRTDINGCLQQAAVDMNIEVTSQHCNDTATLIDQLQRSGQVDGILINTGDLALENQSLCRALRAVTVPCIEVFISHFSDHETYQHRSIVASECVGVIGGFGNHSYVLGLAGLANLLLSQSSVSRH
jgi:3-dehydroquinate dehydratase-2